HFKYEILNQIDGYGNNPTREIFLSDKSTFKSYFSNLIGNKIGYHIFYLSIVHSFHTLFVVVDNTEPSIAEYIIYDESGETSSFGSLNEIGEGIKEQSEWVYRWVKGNPQYNFWPRLITATLKFQ